MTEKNSPIPAADDYATFAEFYDRVVPYRDRPDVAFFVDAALEAGGPVLEVGCGTGRVLLPIARTGVPITGLDASPSMLALCREQLGQEPDTVQQRVRLVEGDMRAFDLGATFQLVTLPFRPFQHLLMVEDQLACLAALRRHLEPGGQLILDLFDPDLARLAEEPGERKHDAEPPFTMPDGRVVERLTRVAERDLARQVLEAELVYRITHPDGRTEERIERIPLRYFFRFEVEHLLARGGLRVRELHGDYDKRPFGKSRPQEMIFVAEAE